MAGIRFANCKAFAVPATCMVALGVVCIAAAAHIRHGIAWHGMAGGYDARENSCPCPPSGRMTVTCHAELKQIDGRKLVFNVSARDAHEQARDWPIVAYVYVYARSYASCASVHGDGYRVQGRCAGGREGWGMAGLVTGECGKGARHWCTLVDCALGPSLTRGREPSASKLSRS